MRIMLMDDYYVALVGRYKIVGQLISLHRPIALNQALVSVDTTESTVDQ